MRHHVLGGGCCHLCGDPAGGLLQNLQRDADQEVQVHLPSFPARDVANKVCQKYPLLWNMYYIPSHQLTCNLTEEGVYIMIYILKREGRHSSGLGRGHSFYVPVPRPPTPPPPPPPRVGVPPPPPGPHPAAGRRPRRASRHGRLNLQPTLNPNPKPLLHPELLTLT